MIGYDDSHAIRNIPSAADCAGMTPELKARQEIDALLAKAGWIVQDSGAVNLYAGRGVAVREFGLKPGHGIADYLLYVDQKAAGVVEAKPAGHTLTGVEAQSSKYSDGMPDNLPAHYKPLPFLYETTGSETRFTNLLDPEPRSRNVFAFHTPDVLAQWVLSGTATGQATPAGIAEPTAAYAIAPNLRQRLTEMPSLDAGNLWPVQQRAIVNLEESLVLAKPRALIQMATGSGKTFTACNLVYRLIKHAGAKRVLFLVDRNNLGRQTLREFQGFDTPDEHRKFTELYNVQLMDSARIDPVSRVCISTIQRVYAMLRGEELDPAQEEISGFDYGQINPQPGTVEYNPAIPISEFDFIITDECHRSIYNLWRQVLEYFDAFLIGLTATPSAQTFGFFQQNLVMEYTHEEAVADRVNVDSDIYRIRTQITEEGSTIEADHHVMRVERRTRKWRWEQLDEDLTYSANQLDRDVVAEDQIRTVIRAFRDRLFTEIFPGRTHVPKTIIFAKDDSHADDIVDIVRTEFGKGNDFCRKITYREHNPEQLIAAFRNSYNPRIVVTVDMIATGTDIKPVEIVFFMRNVQSRNFFEQMKGRGVRVISSTDFNAVTPDAPNKDRFVIVDAVGVTETEMSDSYSLEREPTVSFGRLLDLIAKGSREPDHLSSLASRLARLSHKISPAERESIEATAGGTPLQTLITNLVRATDPDAAIEAARDATGLDEPPPEAIAEAQNRLREAAAKPFASNPDLRQRLEAIHQSHEQTIDTVSKDVVLEAGFTEDAARDAAQSFRQFIEENRDEITALQVLYERPYQQRLHYDDIRALADTLQAPPRAWTTERLWQAYQRLDEDRVRGSGQRQLADIVALVRYAIGDAHELAPFADHVNQRFNGWLAMQETVGREFTAEQRQWLEAIRDHIAGSVSIDPGDFQYAPFNQWGGIMGANNLFGDQLQPIIDELNLELVR